MPLSTTAFPPVRPQPLVIIIPTKLIISTFPRHYHHPNPNYPLWLRIFHALQQLRSKGCPSPSNRCSHVNHTDLSTSQSLSLAWLPKLPQSSRSQLDCNFSPAFHSLQPPTLSRTRLFCLLDHTHILLVIVYFAFALPGSAQLAPEISLARSCHRSSKTFWLCSTVATVGSISCSL